jgi:hypothetical protein
MDSKKIVWFGMVIGSAIGSFIPTLWGAGFLSMWSVFFTAIGGAFGIWLAFKIGG